MKIQLPTIAHSHHASPRKHRLTIRLIRSAALWGAALILNGIARFSTPFSDGYRAHVFPLWLSTYGRLTGLFPFSVGELMIAAGLFFLALMIPALFLRRFRKPYFRAFARILLAVFWVMTLNCFILYQASGYIPKNAPGARSDSTSAITNAASDTAVEVPEADIVSSESLAVCVISSS